MSNKRRRSGSGLPRLSRQDPREFSGPPMTGPGGPHDRGMVLYSSGSVVVLEDIDVCEVDALQVGETQLEKMFVMTLGGRVNKTPDRVDISYIMAADGAAHFVSQLFALAGRSGIKEQFYTAVQKQLKELDADGHLDPRSDQPNGADS